MKTIIVFFALFAAAFGCTCLPLPTFRQAVLGAKDTDAPYAVATVVSENTHKDPKGSGNVQIKYSVRPEGCFDTVVVSTGGNPALCGVRLKVNTKYVLPLKKDRSPTPISSCEREEIFDSLSAADKDFVAKNVPGRCAATSCSAVLCPVGTICRDGKCISTCPKPCPKGFFCNLEKCADRCIFMKCASGYYCKHGQCIPWKCTKHCLRRPCVIGKPCPICNVTGCPNGWDCIWGKCIPPKTCYKKCTDVQCVRAPCPPACVNIGCPMGYECLGGKCFLPSPVG